MSQASISVQTPNQQANSASRKVSSKQTSGSFWSKFRDKAPSTIMLWFLVICFAFPVFWLILSSFKAPTSSLRSLQLLP